MHMQYDAHAVCLCSEVKKLYLLVNVVMSIKGIILMQIIQATGVLNTGLQLLHDCAPLVFSLTV